MATIRIGSNGSRLALLFPYLPVGKYKPIIGRNIQNVDVGPRTEAIYENRIKIHVTRSGKVKGAASVHAGSPKDYDPNKDDEVYVNMLRTSPQIPELKIKI